MRPSESSSTSSTRSSPSGRWVISRTARSPAAAKTSRTSARAAGGSRCAVGSSRTSSSGRASSARATQTRWRWPPDSCRALLADERVPAVGKAFDPVPDPAPRGARLRAPRPSRRAAREQVLADAGREQMRVLAGDGDRAADVLLAQVAEIAAADRDAAVLRVEEAEQEVRRRSSSRRRSRPTSATRQPGSSCREAPSRTGGSSGE